MMTAATNLVLAATCFVCVARLSSPHDVRTRMWRLFLLSLGVAAFTGAFKHGFAEYAYTTWHQAVTLISNLSAGAATYYAQRATMETSLFGARSRHVLLTLVRLQFVVFAGQVAIKPVFGVVVMHTGLGLAGVCAAEWTAYRRGLVKSRWQMIGIATALLPGVVYILRWPSHEWFSHVDAAHVMLAVSCVLILRGAQRAAALEAL
ncbi:MAG TPA: hypothetical protein VMZ90_06220 [Vicinamibacterales bacterium]|nr:hypothetical protein [Vicinamibacterales bacterium]